MHTIMIYFSTRSTCNVAQYFMTCVLFLTLVIRVSFLGNFILSLSLSQIIELEEEEPKLFTKTSKKKKNKTILKELF